MEFRRFCLFVFGFLPAFMLVAGQPFDPTDDSKASSDGPFVFYRGDKVVVKYVEMRDTGASAVVQTYTDKKAVTLTCSVAETGDTFSFPIRHTLSESPGTYPTPSKLLALSDVEGNFVAMKLMLQSAGVIDDHFKWSFGDGHLVLLGDFFDRGINVTECLWLLYKLDAEAEAAGGKLHFILGNHEVINLQGTTAYVRRKYLENAEVIGEDYKSWFDQNSELGRWLRTKNTIEKIGDYAFCHGGISPEMARTRLSIADINRIGRQNLGKPQYFINNPDAQAIFDTKTGVYWYRGLAKNLVTQAEVNDILAFVGAKHIVVGHTIQPDLTGHYGGKVICIDLYHEENLREGFMKTLWMEEGRCYSLDSRGDKASVFSISFPRN